MKNKNCGFSLIEISVVIIVIAVIASFAIPSYHQYMAAQEAKKSPKHSHFTYKKPNMSLCYLDKTLFCVPALALKSVITIGIMVIWFLSIRIKIETMT